MKFDEGTVALYTGLFFGTMHLLWVILVALGVGQLIIDFIYWLHFLNNPFTVAPFTLGRASLLVFFTFVVGYTLGWVFTALWNAMVKKNR